MKLSKLCRTVAVCVASMVAAVGLVSQGLSLNAQTGTVDQDFIVLNQVASQSADKTATQVETLSDWQFTVRTRPPKCRFVD